MPNSGTVDLLLRRKSFNQPHPNDQQKANCIGLTKRLWWTSELDALAKLYDDVGLDVQNPRYARLSCPDMAPQI